MKLLRLVLVLLVAASAFAGTDDLTVRQKYHAGGIIRMHLQAGDYTINGSDSDDIVVTYGTRSRSDAQRVKVKIEAQGSEAEIRVETPDNSNFHAEIDVPKKSAIWVRLTAGDINIAGIEGDKDVSAHAGDIDIRIAKADEYGRVEASSLAGDINASPFGGSKSGIFRDFTWKGPGQYRLHAHVAAGDITLRESD